MGVQHRPGGGAVAGIPSRSAGVASAPGNTGRAATGARATGLAWRTTTGARGAGPRRERVRRPRRRDPARALDLHPLHPRQPALRCAHRRRRVGARLVDRPRRAAGVRERRRSTPGCWSRSLALFLGVAILRAVGIVARRLGAGVMQYRMQAHYRRAVTRQYLSLPMEWHQRHPTGQLLSNANSDVEAAWGPIAPLPMAVGTRRDDGDRRSRRCSSPTSCSRSSGCWSSRP